ncbi:hypothetical protein PR001_g18902 [Phytophthora rubi]|nr:hypothetical protein PR002_g19320 [Phytophthora rubi]KAE9000014.1 hypothetical protein PR001_g18902 [Phytophthora rubi]
MEFVYMLAGWEGSAHDGRVLKDAVAHDFRIPQGKYYLGDAGYALNSFTMTPYRGTRYHLKEFGEGQQKPQTKEELYNLRHSSLRNVIERTYGVVKHKFPILRAMTSYPLKEQVGLMQSSFAIHNFIRVHRDEFADRGTSASHHDDEEDGDTECQLDETDDTEMKALRDSIAAAMWSDYLIVIAGRYGEAVV